MWNRIKNVRPRIVLSLVASTVIVGAAAACGGTTATTTTTTAKLSNIPIIAGTSSTGTQDLPFYVAEANGYFAKADLDVSASTFSGGDPTTMAAFAKGDTNMLEGGVSDAVEYLMNGVIPANGGKFIAELAGNGYDIDTAKSITTLKGIEGHTVGISGPNDGDQLYFDAVMKAYGIPLSSVTFVTAGSTAARLGALEAGSVDAIAESSTDRTTAEQFGNVVLTSTASKVSMPTTSLFASSALLKHPAELKAFVAALNEGTAWIKGHKTAAAAICAKYTGATTTTCTSGIQALESGSFKGGPYTWSTTGAVDVNGVSQTIKVLSGLFPQYHVKLTASQVVDTAIAGTKL